MDNGNTSEHYEYKNYSQYIEAQKKRSEKSGKITVKKIGRRLWIYDQMMKNNVEGDSILCLGSRDVSELNSFKEKGYKIVEGVDLIKDDGIIECDMSKMHEHHYLKDKEYDIVVSLESIEHCLDFKGLLKGLNKICKKFFVCFVTNVNSVNQWDCSKHGFCNNVEYDTLFKRDLHKFFPEFDVVFNKYYSKNNFIFFILEKKNNFNTESIIEPTMRVRHGNRKKFLKYVPRKAVCAELGCFEGHFSKYIIGITNPVKLYLVDPYWKIYGDRFWWKNYNTFDCFRRAVETVSEVDKENCASFVIDTDESFLSDLKDEFFDWVYLDSTHEYADTLKELDLISKKVKEDGLICGHDFKKDIYNIHFGVTKAIVRWLDKNKDFELYLLDNHMQWIIRRKL